MTISRVVWAVFVAPLGADAAVLGVRATTDAAQCVLLFVGTLMLVSGLLLTPTRH